MVEAVVPWRAGCPHREQALAWVRGRLPYPATIADAPPGAWSKGAAVMPAASNSSAADILVIHDADVWAPALPEAVRAVEAGAAWAIPHRGVFRLAEDSTRRFMRGGPWEGLPLAERPYLGVPGGGVVVIHRALLESVPLDPRFRGWGGEDESWGWALATMLGPPVRLKAPLVHCWHPPQERVSRARGSRENWALRRRYYKARGNPAAMARLLTEARLALGPTVPHGHDHATHA